MLKLNLYSKNKSLQDDVKSEVTGHDRFGHVGVHRSAKSSSMANSFTPSPKWRIQKEALLRQQRQAERWRRSSGLRGDGYGPINSQQPSSARTIKEENEYSSESQIKVNSRSSFFGLSWARQLLQHLLACRSEGCPNQTEESPEYLIPWYSSRTKDCSSNGSTGVGSVLDGEEMVGIPGGSSGSGAMSGGAECIELLELERRMPRARGSDIRELATNICRQYIRSSSRYHLLDHLKDIGSRIDKQWFMIRDSSLKTERLLTIVPLSGSPAYGCEVTTTDADATRNALIDLFTALQHPYIYPVLDVDFVYGAVASSNSPFCEEAKPVLVTVFPFNTKGSLKDLIYRSRWQDDWGQKYCQRSEGLPLLQVQRLGRQILEALLFLQERGFPPFGHLHSGNVIIQNGVARLTGFENTLLGFSSRIHPMVKSILPATPAVSIDTICFGHVLFEMCSGYELYAPKPTARHLEDLHSYPQVIEVLDYIFNNPSEEYPTIASLAILEFFRNIDLREMRCSTVILSSLTHLIEPIQALVQRV